MMYWKSVERVLPGTESGWVIVRCINKDESEFYFMASYTDQGWVFFDDGYEELMTVTHWTEPDDVNKPDIFLPWMTNR